MCGGEPLGWPRMHDVRSRQPASRKLPQSVPVETVALAALAQLGSPQPGQPVAKESQAVEVSRYRMIVEVALHDRPEPFARVRNRIMPTLPELLLKFLQLPPQALADRLAFHGKLPPPVLPANVREAQKVERLRLTFSSSFPVELGKRPELNPARFVRMQFQSKLPQPFQEILQETVGFRLRLETEDRVSSAGESHPDALSEPYLNVSAHTAPAREPRRTPICQCANSLGSRREMRAPQCVALRKCGRSFLYFR